MGLLLVPNCRIGVLNCRIGVLTLGAVFQELEIMRPHLPETAQP